MLPSLLQHQVFGELKFKHQPKVTNCWQNTFFLFTKSSLFGLGTPNRSKKKRFGNIFQEKLKKIRLSCQTQKKIAKKGNDTHFFMVE